ncbi:hypothetical protein THAOC_27435 [Thalassiosira oceanica]|uniref:RING-type domain-containing protein n=1 Tax=Thalassiosira oceanica TaxID=159749 RepID=K0RLR2_THAOC|nr:hypothetical protein THAOC_27435 [Thalassiosira oceanica]|eukprot:EJK53184.1 hypothetical protein THAOC_27435 [Thalassiosira oceanica]
MTEELGCYIHTHRDIMTFSFCGACERVLPDDAFDEEQRRRRQSVRRCEDCVAAGNELVLMKRGTARDEEDVCSVCQLPLPIAMRESMLQPCCMKRVCNGCILSAKKCGIIKNGCPLCRAPIAKEREGLAMVIKWAAVLDPVAVCFLGSLHTCGGYGLEKDPKHAIELCQKATDLGAKDAHFILGDAYRKKWETCSTEVGSDCDTCRDKSFQHYEKAATEGHIFARFKLGVLEYKEGHRDLALQHFLISAKMGHKQSMNNVKRLLTEGISTEADCAEAQQDYEAAVEEMSSTSREEAKKMGADKIRTYFRSSP